MKSEKLPREKLHVFTARKVTRSSKPRHVSARRKKLHDRHPKVLANRSKRLPAAEYFPNDAIDFP